MNHYDEFGDWEDVRPGRQADVPVPPPRPECQRVTSPQLVQQAEQEDAGREKGEPFEELR